jgi:hypothetical protein
MGAVGMDRVLLMMCYGMLPAPAILGTQGVVVAPAFPVVLFPGDFGWYRVTGLEHMYDQMLAESEAQRSLAAMIPGGKTH